MTRWLKGLADPTRTNLIKLAQATGVTVEWLATGEESDTTKHKNTHAHNPLTIEQALASPTTSHSKAKAQR